MPRRAMSAGFSRVIFLPLKKNRTRSRLQEFGQQIEEGRFAGAVRADQRVDFSAPHADRHAVDRNESLERPSPDCASRG